MNSTTGTTSRFRPGICAALLATLALVLSTVVAMPAHAATGYTGQAVAPWGTNSTWDSNGGTRTLPLMTSGLAYTGAITGPQFGIVRSYSWMVDAGSLPDGLELTTSSGPQAIITGTPSSTDDFAFTLSASEGEDYYPLHFEGSVESGKTTTTTVVDSGALYPASAVLFSAVVTAIDSTAITGGTVQFSLGGTAIGSPVAVGSGGKATLTTSVDAALVGDRTITAQYSGDVTYSTSSGSSPVTIYAGSSVAGIVSINGVPQSGLTVTLEPTTDAIPENTQVTTTLSDGSYAFAVTIVTVNDAKRSYTITATFDDTTERSWNAAGTQVGADSTGPMSWDGSTHDIELAVPPVWTDLDILAPQRGSYYSADVAATGGTVTYSVTGGALPQGLDLHPTTGLISGTPDCAAPAGADEGCAYSFTVTANNGYGTVTHLFTGSVLRPGIPPTWTDESDTALALQETMPFVGGVEAEGDPEIEYAVTAGALPTGLSLDSETGAIAGTPACGVPAGSADPCEYTVTITATNDYGSVDRTYTGVIAAKPAIDLQLDFASGTPIDLARSAITGNGLQVGSTYTLEMFSTPVLLHTGTIGADGGFSHAIRLPSTTPTGMHRLLLTGVAPDGTVMTAEAWFTLLSNGRIGAVSYTGPLAMPSLASTGADAPVPLAVGAMLLILIGAALLRRRTAH